MIPSNEFAALVIGLPEAGKTTFLAAFWHSVKQGDGNSALRLSKLQPLRDYLNAIAEAWLKCERLSRTTLATEQTVTITVTERTREGPETAVVFPDHAGEKFVQQWLHRQWDPEYASLVGKAGAVLLFINPEKHAPAPTISDALLLAQAIEPELPAGQDDEIAEWDPSSAPADVQLVDILQSVLWIRNTPSLPVAVVISAWDVVKPMGLTPREWLKRNSPLLSQFLEANITAENCEVFGVSGQGGDLTRDADRLLEMLDPAERVEVVTQSVSTHDITRPIQWILGIQGDG